MAAIYEKKNRPGFFVNLGGMTITLAKTESESYARYAEILGGKPFKGKKKGWLIYREGEIVPADAPAAGPAPAAAADGSPAPAPVVTGPTLADIIAKWRAHLKANANPATYQSYERYARRWAEVHGHKPAASIIGADITEAADKLYPKVNNDPNVNGGKPYSDTCRWQHAKVAKQIFVFAKSEGLVSVNSIEGYRSKVKCGKRDVDLSREQFDKLLAACDDPAFRDVLVVLYDTGCRPKEAFDATAKHLDREHKCLRYAKAKGGKPRIVCLTDRAFNILARLADLYPEGTLLRNRISRKWAIGPADARLRTLEARTGIKVTCYVFRHAFCTRMVKEGKNLVQLQQQMGHASLKMISEVYAHVGGDTANIRASLFDTPKRDDGDEPPAAVPVAA